MSKKIKKIRLSITQLNSIWTPFIDWINEKRPEWEGGKRGWLPILEQDFPGVTVLFADEYEYVDSFEFDSAETQIAFFLRFAS